MNFPGWYERTVYFADGQPTRVVAPTPCSECRQQAVHAPITSHFTAASGLRLTAVGHACDEHYEHVMHKMGEEYGTASTAGPHEFYREDGLDAAGSMPHGRTKPSDISPRA